MGSNVRHNRGTYEGRRKDDSFYRHGSHITAIRIMVDLPVTSSPPLISTEDLRAKADIIGEATDSSHASLH